MPTCVRLCLAVLAQITVNGTRNGTPQKPTSAELLEVEERVMVTATRSARRIQDEPLRVEVIDREQIEEKR